MDNYEKIAQYYKEAFDQHGDTPEGLAWQNWETMQKRFEVMSELINFYSLKSQTLLDLGCGTGHFFTYLKDNYPYIEYEGADINQTVVDHCNQTYPAKFYQLDALKDTFPIYDYIVMNGIFTVKDKLSFDEMFEFFTNLITKAFEHSNKGISFNVMSKQVDWEREDLFHLPLDTIASFLCKNLSRHFVIRNDYGLYEYTVYVYKQI